MGGKKAQKPFILMKIQPFYMSNFIHISKHTGVCVHTLACSRNGGWWFPYRPVVTVSGEDRVRAHTHTHTHTPRNRSRCSTCAEVHTLFMYNSKVHSHTHSAVCEHGTAGSSTEENKRQLPVTEMHEGDETYFTPYIFDISQPVFHVNPTSSSFSSAVCFLVTQ